MNRSQKTIELILVLLLIVSVVAWISSNLLAPADMSTAGFAILGFLGSVLFLILSVAFPQIVLWRKKRNS